MIVEVDCINTVFIINRLIDSITTIQVNEDENFHIIYSEGDDDLASIYIFPNGDINIIDDVGYKISG
jgi:hypothetical protein